jgi:hypothetical protein
VDQTDTVVPTSTGGSTIILSPQLAASKPHLEVFNLYHFIIFARSFMDWRMMGTTTLTMRMTQSFSQDLLETAMIDLNIPDFLQFRRLEDHELIQRCNVFFERSGIHPLVHSLREMGEKSKTDTKNFYCLTTRLDKPLHDKFINRWKWILDTFTCLQTLGTRNIIQMIISVIPHFQFKLLVSDFKCDSVDDFFIYLKSIGDN